MITEETKIKDMLKQHPETAAVMKRHKLDCFGCLGLEQESVRNAAWSHGMDVGRLLKELNDAVKRG